MPHETCCKVSCGRRILSSESKKRRTSQPAIWQAIQEFKEDLPYNEPICDPCASKLKKQYASIQSARRQAANSNTANGEPSVVDADNEAPNERQVEEAIRVQEEMDNQEQMAVEEVGATQEPADNCSIKISRKAKPAHYYDVR